MNGRIAGALAAGIVVVIGIAVPVVVLTHNGSAGTPATAVAPLSATDRRVLLADQSLIENLPEALAEVPRAAANAAGVDPVIAHADLAGSAALQPLVAAVEGRSSAVTALVAAYRALVDRRALPQIAALPGALETLQAIEGDVVPAVRVVALQHGRHLSAADALTVVERDPATATLERLLANWSQAYGAFVLVEQAAAR